MSIIIPVVTNHLKFFLNQIKQSRKQRKYFSVSMNYLRVFLVLNHHRHTGDGAAEEEDYLTMQKY